MMKILLVDDDALVLESLSIILKAHRAYDIVGLCENGQEALTFLTGHSVDVVLMDIEMPLMNGIEACAQITKQHPQVKVIMLTTFRDFKSVHQALQAGAKGYLLKTDDLKLQLDTIEQVSRGQAVFSQAALEAFTTQRRTSLLTPRENECMELIAHGYANKEIASRMFVSEGTVRNMISVMLDKLECRDRTQLAIYYWQSLQSS